MVHYLNAAYYTNGSLKEEDVTRKIKSVLLTSDEIGLHLHPWENLVDASGVDFISGPTYFGEEQTPYKGVGSEHYPLGHRGGDIPLWRYEKEDIRKMIRFSVEKLNQHGFHNITSFRAGGWQSDSRVLEVLSEEGFVTESSPVPAQKVASLYGDKPLASYVSELWKETTSLSTPYISEQGPLMMPNNAGLADYVDSNEFMEVLDENLMSNGQEDLHLVYGFHFETAQEYLDRVEEVILKLEEFSRTTGRRIVPAVYQQTTPTILKKIKSVNCFSLLNSFI